MKKMFFTVLIVVAALVISKMIQLKKTDEATAADLAAANEAIVFDVANEQITEEDMTDTALEVEEENPELTANDDETIVEE